MDCFNLCDECDGRPVENEYEYETLDDIANTCGYFSDEGEYSYNCTHDNNKDQCLSAQCPIAYPATCYRDSSFDGDTLMVRRESEFE